MTDPWGETVYSPCMNGWNFMGFHVGKYTVRPMDPMGLKHDDFTKDPLLTFMESTVLLSVLAGANIHSFSMFLWAVYSGFYHFFEFSCFYQFFEFSGLYHFCWVFFNPRNLEKWFSIWLARTPHMFFTGARNGFPNTFVEPPWIHQLVRKPIAPWPNHRTMASWFAYTQEVHLDQAFSLGSREYCTVEAQKLEGSSFSIEWFF